MANITFFKVLTLPDVPKANAMYILETSETECEIWVTTKDGDYTRQFPDKVYLKSVIDELFPNMGGIEAIVEDTSPELGGDLILNGHSIKGTIEDNTFILDGG